MTPFAAMALWQAVALAAVLSALGAGLSLATGRTLTGEPSLPGLVVAALALTVTLVVVARLLVSGHRVGTSLRAQRRVHREQIDLVAGRLEDLHILEHDVPVAYCLPGVAKSRVVVSAAALERLERPQLAAVLAHERAHLSARHDLVLEAFTVLHRAFPRWVSSDAALREVQLLVEILADRAAVRVGGRTSSAPPCWPWPRAGCRPGRWARPARTWSSGSGCSLTRTPGTPRGSSWCCARGPCWCCPPPWSSPPGSSVCAADAAPGSPADGPRPGRDTRSVVPVTGVTGGLLS